MGSLDDAIREHLELKRQHGASEDEVKQQEQEAFGRDRRPSPEPSVQEQVADDPLAPDDLGAPDELAAAELEAAEPEANGQPATPVEPAAYDDLPASTFEPELLDPDEVPSDESLEPGMSVRETRDEGPDWAPREPRPGAASDPLEETPEFLEESPEEDRLWFEQRPPKDFDLD
jgi:hypothetical protein